MCTNNSLGVAVALGSEPDISLPLSALNKPINSLGYGCNTHTVWCNHLLLPVLYLWNQNSATWAHAVSSAPPRKSLGGALTASVTLLKTAASRCSCWVVTRSIFHGAPLMVVAWLSSVVWKQAPGSLALGEELSEGENAICSLEGHQERMKREGHYYKVSWEVSFRFKSTI